MLFAEAPLAPILTDRLAFSYLMRKLAGDG